MSETRLFPSHRPARFICVLAALLLWRGLTGCVLLPAADGGQDVTPVRDTAICTYVVDGDTIRVELGDGERATVRYIGIDCPEADQPFGDEATAANRLLVEGQKLLLERDVSETDRYGRLLRYVYLVDGTFVNGELVKGGHARARAYPPDVARQDELSTYPKIGRG